MYENPNQPAAPVMLNLAPLRMGQILDQAIQLYRRNFVTFVGILAVVLIPINLLSILSTTIMQNLEFTFRGEPTTLSILAALGSFGGVLVSLILQFIFVQGFGSAALTRSIADTYAAQPSTTSRAYRQSSGLWKRLLGALLFASLVNLGLTFWTFIPCIGWVTGLGAMIFFNATVVPLLAPVVVLEEHNASGSVRRAWDLARARIWWMLGFAIVVGLFGLLIVQGPVLLANSALTYLPFDSLDAQLTATLQTVITSLVSLASSLVFIPLQTTAFILVYFDLRVRCEGLDMAVAVAQLNGPLTDLQPVTASSAPGPRSELFSSRDWGVFALLTIAGVVVYFIIFGAIFAAMTAMYPGL